MKKCSSSQQRDAAEDRPAAQHQRGGDAVEQQPRAVLGRHPEVREQQDEHEQVVERQRALDEVDGRVGDEVVEPVGVEDQQRQAGEHRHHQPADAPHHALAEARLAAAREEVQVDPQQEDRDRRQRGPRASISRRRRRCSPARRRPRAAGGPRTTSTRPRASPPGRSGSRGRSRPSSSPLKTSDIGYGPRNSESSTSTGATNSAICALEPIAMLTDRSILSFMAKNTATQCSAALPTIATTMMATKNGDSPIDSDASVDRADEDLRHHADRDAGDREHGHGLAHRPRLALLVLGVVLGVEEVAVGLEREEQPRDVGDQQHARDQRPTGARCRRRS